MSTYPDRYRGVSVTDVDVPLEAGPLRDLLMTRPVYRRSTFMVVRSAGRVALLRLVRGAETGLFAPLEDVELLAGPEETVYLHRPDLDTAVPTALLTAAAGAPGMRCVVVEGAYGHVSFVLDPAPVRVHVLDVEPPRPAKLVDQLQRVLATADDLPGIELVPHVIELADLLPNPPDGSCLLPCRGGGLEVPGASVAYLDEVPPRTDWTLLGCTRSRQIHDTLYGSADSHPPPRQIDMCPRALAARVEIPDGDVLLTKCCLFEDRNEVDGRTVLTPWGASFGELRGALATAVTLAMTPKTAPVRS
jgi:hypothetical protein